MIGISSAYRRGENRRTQNPRDLKKNGAEVDEVDERNFGPRAVICFEFEAYPEPKILNLTELRALYDRYGSYYEVADAIGTSESFARQTSHKNPGLT